MKKMISVSLVALASLSAPAFAEPGASGVAGAYGEIHKGLATSGATGQGPNRGGHVPGQVHGGMTGIAGIGKGA